MEVAAQVEFIAFGVAAEIVVIIIENEDAALGRCQRTVEVRGGETADAAAHGDEVVLRAGLVGLGSLEGVRVTAAQAREQRRVVACGVCAADGGSDAPSSGLEAAAPKARPFGKSRRVMG
jgi:hypothetical protein